MTRLPSKSFLDKRLTHKNPNLLSRGLKAKLLSGGGQECQRLWEISSVTTDCRPEKLLLLLVDSQWLQEETPRLPQPFLHPRFGDKGPKGRNSSVTFGRLVTLDARNFGLWPAVAGRRGGDSSFTNILLALDSRFSIFYSSFLVVRLEAWNLRSPPRR